MKLLSTHCVLIASKELVAIIYLKNKLPSESVWSVFAVAAAIIIHGCQSLWKAEM